MAVMKVIARMPLNYNDFGRYAMTDEGYERYDEIISGMLPDEVSWCGNELLAPADYDGELDLDDIIERAGNQMLNNEDGEYWLDEYC